ncbi:LLM class flavin-dependent oxidoreductase [Planotetraspora sp. A-T 1434]|uniref:LLM class flavin-dependent oxidoreductase n=1 Tax=Planotetraspora sp. A-T 1434 TaxID=2979219 RepID=UPI0021BFA3BE|nr:LLM class flavin-dependent oxidoreductase [Planotetraspora sp. A-T 1434]MCT9932037.1 LLM class flavin-dependent oxidoreductase [Planotetraspora sp. A-T 1434]
MTKHFRFGIVAALAPDAGAWAALARRTEDLGYSTLLVPDTLGTLPPLLALTAAATATTRLRLGTFVLAAPYRNPRQLAWELAGLDFLSGGRLEVGVGAGRPDAREDAAALGMPYGTAGERIAQVEAVIAETRAAFGEARAAFGQAGAASSETTAASSKSGRFSQVVQRQGPPILVAGAGERMMAVAAKEADIVTLALPPDSTDDDLRRPIDALRGMAGARFDQIELSVNLLQVGPRPAPWLPAGYQGPPPGAVAVLDGSPREMADVLLRRRDELGVSYVTVNGFYAETLAPVVELLTGR